MLRDERCGEADSCCCDIKWDVCREKSRRKLQQRLHRRRYHHISIISASTMSPSPADAAHRLPQASSHHRHHNRHTTLTTPLEHTAADRSMKPVFCFEILVRQSVFSSNCRCPDPKRFYDYLL